LNKQELEILNNQNNIHNYYLVVYGESISDLENKRTKILGHLLNTKFNPKIIEKKELVEVLNLIFKVPLNTTNYDNFDLNLLAPTSVEFNKKYLKVDDKFVSFQSINDFNNIEIPEG